MHVIDQIALKEIMKMMEIDFDFYSISEMASSLISFPTEEGFDRSEVRVLSQFLMNFLYYRRVWTWTFQDW